MTELADLRDDEHVEVITIPIEENADNMKKRNLLQHGFHTYLEVLCKLKASS